MQLFVGVNIVLLGKLVCSVNVVVIRYGARHNEKKHKHSPSKHSFTLIENDKSSQINQKIWRMLRVGVPNVFWQTSPTSAIISYMNLVLCSTLSSELPPQ